MSSATSKTSRTVLVSKSGSRAKKGVTANLPPVALQERHAHWHSIVIQEADGAAEQTAETRTGFMPPIGSAQLRCRPVVHQLFLTRELLLRVLNHRLDDVIDHVERAFAGEVVIVRHARE